MWNYSFTLGDNDSITQITPLKSLKKSDQILNSPSGLWTVTPDDTGKQIINESIPSINSAVKKRLIFKENNAENSGICVIYFSLLLDIY